MKIAGGGGYPRRRRGGWVKAPWGCLWGGGGANIIFLRSRNSKDRMTDRTRVTALQDVGDVVPVGIASLGTLESQLFEELQSHSGLTTPTPTPHSPRPDFDPLSDPIST